MKKCVFKNQLQSRAFEKDFKNEEKKRHFNFMYQHIKTLVTCALKDTLSFNSTSIFL